MKYLEVNNKELIEELELELDCLLAGEPEYETCWETMTGILLSNHTVKQIVKQLKQLEQIYNQ